MAQTHLYGGPHHGEHLSLQTTVHGIATQSEMKWTCNCHSALYRGLAGEGALWYQRERGDIPLPFVKAFAEKDKLDG